MSNFFLESVKEVSLTSLNDRNDLTRMAYQNKSSDIPIRNNSMTDRFESDTFINHKESFESNNSRINSLNEEIRELKDKLKLVYEKDELISSLKAECETLQKEVEDYNKAKRENKFLSDETNHLKTQLSKFESLKDENDLLKKQLLELKSTEKTTEKTTEKIIVDVEKIKKVLFTRLKSYHEKHIDELIDQYDLTKKKEIDKATMEEILLQAIHV
jgi:predicted RNase H-like nuclease (RuvC/YqgF family)